jgi:hypothetical protein
MGGGSFEAIAWDLVEDHRAQAQRNHGQSLERLAERGGLSSAELVAVLQDRPCYPGDGDGHRQLEAILSARGI